MLPLAQPAARFWSVAAASTMVLGAVVDSVAAIAVGATLALSLAWAFAMTLPRARRARKERLEFAWWVSRERAGGVLPGRPVKVHCFLRHKGRSALRAHRLRPLVRNEAEVRGEGQRLVLPPATRLDFEFEIIPKAPGRVVLDGLALTLVGPLGLYEFPLYFPNPLIVRVWPRSMRLTSRAKAVDLGAHPLERPGVSRLSPADSGIELRELRELRPGDPFRAIAWKASARRGRLLVREVEQEVQRTHILIADLGGRNRRGELGHRPVDRLLDAIVADAKRAIEVGDRVALYTVDSDRIRHLAAGEGSVHLRRVVDALVEELEVVDASLTAVREHEVIDAVGRYIQRQDGVDLGQDSPRDKRRRQWDVGRLVKHAERALAEARDRSKADAESTTLETLRRFCRLRAIELPHRLDIGSAKGVLQVLKKVASERGPALSVSVYGGADALNEERAPAVLGMLHRHGHRIEWLVAKLEKRTALSKLEAFGETSINMRALHIRAIGGRKGAA